MTTERPVLKIVDCVSLPEQPSDNIAYRLLPAKTDPDHYFARTNRNIGWITPEEQLLLRGMTVSIAGAGGMGGWLDEIEPRLGVGELRMADPETYVVSNLNRQAGASEASIGESKAFATARRVRSVISDTPMLVFPQGICEESVDTFLTGCDLVFDMIEFFAIGARVLLHRRMRELGIPVLLNFNSIGHRSYGFKYTPESMTVEEALGISYEEACQLEAAAKNQEDSVASLEARARIIEAVMRAFTPEFPEYGAGTYSTRDAVYAGLREGRASIVTPNPVMAAGFAGNRAIVEMLYKRSDVPRKFCEMPAMPGYLSFDALLMEARVHTGAWWRL